MYVQIYDRLVQAHEIAENPEECETHSRINGTNSNIIILILD